MESGSICSSVTGCSLSTLWEHKVTQLWRETLWSCLQNFKIEWAQSHFWAHILRNGDQGLRSRLHCRLMLCPNPFSIARMRCLGHSQHPGEIIQRGCSWPSWSMAAGRQRGPGAAGDSLRDETTAMKQKARELTGNAVGLWNFKTLSQGHTSFSKATPHNPS